jgi:hypothetical protein
LPTNYGMHRFYVASRIDQLDPKVVASIFLYKSNIKEIDIEFSRWENTWPWANNAQYVVQPSPYTSDNFHPFIFGLNGNYSTHYINLESSQVLFKSFHGHYPEPPSPDYLIQSWKYTGDKNPPESADLHVHINLWLIKGESPLNGREIEYIIKAAELPYDAVRPKAPENLRIIDAR